jgi:glycosyltransferase involved in cell wall biosynthesis
LPSGLRSVKNIKLALDSLATVHEEFPEVRLLIMGTAIDDEYSGQIKDRIRDLSWAIYLGEIPHADMMSILDLGDIVINTSLCEGQPQGALEAMSLGKPCILTAVPGNLNIFEPGVEGFYVDNQEELIRAAKVLIKDPVQRSKMGQRAAKLIESSFTLRQELDAYSRIYNQYLKE